MKESLPQVIFFDAVGTLFGVKGSVGEIYSAIALTHGVEVTATELDQAFRNSFSSTEPLAFGNLPQENLAEKEFLWWQKVAAATFKKAKVLDDFTDFEVFFQELYGYFATEKPWFLYEEVTNVLDSWQQKQIPLGIISNFDTRIYKLLQLLNLEKYFTTITISSEVGAAKPASKIFKTALVKHSCQPENAWYIGDSFTEDYQGAKQIGMKAFWLRRDQKLNLSKNQLPTLNSLG